jgi:ribosome-interacting GTPase 1
MDLVKTILGEYRIHNADITLRYDATSEDLIDVIEGNRVYIPCIYVLNKIDQISIEVSEILLQLQVSWVKLIIVRRMNDDDV